ADTLGMTGLILRWQAGLAAAKREPTRTESHLVQVTLAPQGGWRVALGPDVATVPDLVGMRYIAQLVAAPNQDMPAVALVIDQGGGPLGNSEQKIMDAAAVTTVRERIRTLRQQPMLTLDEQNELDGLVHEFTRACGLGGRMRSFADVPERARTAVRKAVKRAIEQVSAANAVVGRHLAARIKTGAVCRYCITDQMSN